MFEEASSEKERLIILVLLIVERIVLGNACSSLTMVGVQINANNHYSGPHFLPRTHVRLHYSTSLRY